MSELINGTVDGAPLTQEQLVSLRDEVLRLEGITWRPGVSASVD